MAKEMGIAFHPWPDPIGLPERKTIDWDSTEWFEGEIKVNEKSYNGLNAPEQPFG